MVGRGNWGSLESEATQISTRDYKIVNQLLLDAKNAWKAAEEKLISIHSSNIEIDSRPKRPLGSIVLSVGTKEKILSDAKDFLDSRKWYMERGIPFRRGCLLVSLSWSQ